MNVQKIYPQELASLIHNKPLAEAISEIYVDQNLRFRIDLPVCPLGGKKFPIIFPVITPLENTYENYNLDKWIELLKSKKQLLIYPHLNHDKTLILEQIVPNIALEQLIWTNIRQSYSKDRN